MFGSRLPSPLSVVTITNAGHWPGTGFKKRLSASSIVSRNALAPPSDANRATSARSLARSVLGGVRTRICPPEEMKATSSISGNSSMKAFRAVRKLFIIGPTGVLESTSSTIRIGAVPSVTRTTSRFEPFSSTWKSSLARFSTGAPPVSTALT